MYYSVIISHNTKCNQSLLTTSFHLSLKNERKNERMTEWQNERMKERKNEWMKERKKERKKEREVFWCICFEMVFFVCLNHTCLCLFLSLSLFLSLIVFLISLASVKGILWCSDFTNQKLAAFFLSLLSASIFQAETSNPISSWSNS